jgi:ribosomal protein S18 acetylase RimI-like enzyme|tara:strand:- start:129 stop:581 length:453 start_codon:yes stop_codon:yes gene_type:complete
MGHLRKATLKDFKYVVNNMRVMDKIEAHYQTGMKPEDALSFTYMGSEVNMAIANDNDEPIGLCGVQNDGCIWCVATDDLYSNKKYRIQLIRQGREWVDNLLGSYKILYNYVYAENTSAIKWLKSLGFTFVNYHKEFGLQQKPFYEFLRIA